MFQASLRGPIFDWMVRPHAELRARVEALRTAVEDKADDILNLLAIREAMFHQEGDGEAATPAGDRVLDIRVRSTMIRDSTASAIRREMGAILTLVQTWDQLERVGEPAYALLAATEEFLALARGDGWIFAHRDIAQDSEDVRDLVQDYEACLSEALDEFRARLDELHGKLVAAVRRYGVARYLFLFLLLAGPLVGLWAGFQLGYEQGPQPLPRLWYPRSAMRVLQGLMAGERLVRKEGGVVWEAWPLTSTPTQVLDRQTGRLGDDLAWAETLCRLMAHQDTRPEMVAHCRELVLSLEATTSTLEGLHSTMEQQEQLLREVVGDCLDEVEGTMPRARMIDPPQAEAGGKP